MKEKDVMQPNSKNGIPNGNNVKNSGRPTSSQSNNDHQNDMSVKGELTYEDKVVQKIIGIALEEIDGLLTVDGGFFSNVKDKLVNNDDVRAGINTEVGKKQVAVDMDIVAEYGTDIEDIFEQMKKVITREVKEMTHLEVIEVNVNVVDVKTREEYENDSETVQDKVKSAADTTGDFASRKTNDAKRAMNQGRHKMDEKREPRVE